MLSGLEGLLIVVEGPDGCGKTTQSSRLADTLGAEWTCFPQRGTYYGKLIDSWLKGKWKAVYTPEPTVTDQFHDGPTIQELLNAAVFQAVQTVNRLEVIECLSRNGEGPLVVDRYWPSGYAYGSADGLNPALMMRLHASLPQPDLMILLECPLEEIEKRLLNRTATKRDFYESKGRAYFEKVASAYDQLWKLHAGDRSWVRIPFGSEKETQERLVESVLTFASGGV